jgi:hypothetical protein
MTAPPAPRVRPSEKEIKAKRAEIARRYQRRKSKIDIDKVIRGGRRNEIEDLVRYRHKTLPDTDDRSTYLRFWAWHNLHSKHQREDLQAFGRRLGVTLPDGELEATVRYVQRRELRKFLASTLGEHLQLTDDERTVLHITTIEAHNITPAERRRRRREMKIVKQRERRRAQGVKPRVVYEQNSLTRTKPWEAQGISRTTWYRRRRNKAGKQPGTSLRASTLLTGLEGRTPVPIGTPPVLHLQQARGLPREEPLVPSLDLSAYERLPLEVRLACLCLPLASPALATPRRARSEHSLSYENQRGF